MGNKLQYFTFPEEGIFALLLAPAACAAIGDCGQGTTKGNMESETCVNMTVFESMHGFPCKDIVPAGPDRGHEWT